MAENGPEKWWGEIQVPPDRWAHWEIGPLHLWARPSPGEWRLAWRSESDPMLERQSLDNPANDEPDVDSLELARFALESTGSGLRLTPRLADLSVIVRPETSLWIPPGQRTVLYVGTAVLIRIDSTGPGQPRLIELPTFRSSDTWFGNNTRVGEMCYATRTKARTRVELLGRVPHRAVTPVELVNFGTDTLHIEQLRIPVPALSLFEANGRLWTDGVRFTRDQDHSNAQFDIVKESAYLPESRKTIAAPSEPLQQKTVIQAFGSLFT